MDAAVRIAEHDDLTIATLAGEIDLSNAPRIRRHLLEAAGAESSGVVVNVEAVRYLDSLGVRMLFEVATRVRSTRRRIVLVAPEASPLRRLLSVTRMDEILPVVCSLEEAQAHLDGRG